VLLFSVVLSACGAIATKSSEPAATTPPEKDPAVTEAAPVRDPIQAAEQTLEQRLLARAEEAFRKGRLTSPTNKNAYDLFHSVLLLNPDNQTARSGLQAIMIRFSELIRDAMASSNYSSANALLKQAQIYFPGNSLLLDLQKDLRKQRTRYHQTVLNRPTEDLTVQEFPLPTDLLSDDREQLLPFLGSVAQRVKVTDESVMIYARTDSEGRWIYQQLKKAVPGYRVRGDIRLSKDPKIAILPPL